MKHVHCKLVHVLSFLVSLFVFISTIKSNPWKGARDCSSNVFTNLYHNDD